MRQDQSIKSWAKRGAPRIARVGIVVLVASLVIVATGGGLSDLAHSNNGSGEKFVGTVAAQSEESTGSYNITNTDFGNQPLRVGQEVQVTATIRNTDNNQLSTSVGLGTQGQVVDSQDVSLFPGSSQQITFTHEYESPGTYTMQIGTLNETDVMTQVDAEDTRVRVISGDAATDVAGQVGTSATTGGDGVSAIPTATAKGGSGGVPIAEGSGLLQVTDLAVASGSPPYSPGELVSFQTNISNPTSQQLNGSFAFSVNNGTVSQQTVTVPSGESQSIVFTHRFAEAGNYTVSVGNQTQTVAVQPAPTTNGEVPNVTATTANASAEGSSGGGFGIGGLLNSFGIILGTVTGIVIMVVVAFVLWYRMTTSPEKMNRQ